MKIANHVQWSGITVLAVLPALAPAQDAPKASATVRQIGELQLRLPIEHDLGPGLTDVFTVRATAGQFLHVIVEQKGVYVVITLADPNGKTFEAPETIRAFGASPASLITPEAGDFQIRVAPSGRASVTGKYRIELTDLHPPTDKDRTEIQAEAEFIAAAHQQAIKDRQHALLAIDGYQRAATLWHSIGYNAGEALSLQRIGATHQVSLGDSRKALDYFNKALPLWTASGESANVGLNLTDMGICYYHLGDMKEAIDYQSRAIVQYRAAGDQVGEARALINTANVYSDTGDRLKAIEYFQQALTQVRASGERAGEGATLNNMGWAYFRLGQMEQALDYYNQALPLRRAVKDNSGEALTLKNIGVVYWTLGERQKALDYFNQALPLYRGVGDRWGQAGIQEDSGSIYQELGDYRKALEYENSALALFTAMEDRPGQASVLNNIGMIYVGTGDKAQALNYLARALPNERAVGDHDAEVTTLNEIGTVYLSQGKKQAALQQYIQALQLADSMSNPYLKGDTLSNLMDYWRADQRPALAIFFGKQTVNQEQELRRNITQLDQDLQQSYLATVSERYRKLADLLIAQGRLSEAEQVLALLKETEYFDYVRRDASEASSVNGRADLNPEEDAAQKRCNEISSRLMTIGAERGDLLAKKSLTETEKQRLDQLERDIAVSNGEFEKLLDDLAQQFSAKPQLALRVEEMRETQGIMEDLRELPRGTVAILTVVGEDKFRTILRTADVQKAYEYPITAAELNRKVASFRQVLLDPRLDPRPLAAELYKILVGPMANDLRQAHAQTLMWSLDGTLRYLPISALFDGKQYLIENYRVSVMTLASTARLKDHPAAEETAVGFGVTKASEHAPALPWVAAELAGIIAAKPGDKGVLPGEVQLDGEFTRQSMRQELLKHYGVVHIASHFRFEAGNDTQSYLLLGDGGHLSLADLRTSANLFGGVQLLTLSACNTGMGDGAEVEGFGTLAQRQGAKAVIASLWPVADVSTSLLMQNFYHNWQSSPGITKLEALREAQLELLHGGTKSTPESSSRSLSFAEVPNGDHPVAPPFPTPSNAPYSHPYYWAPFFLMGNWL